MDRTPKASAKEPISDPPTRLGLVVRDMAGRDLAQVAQVAEEAGVTHLFLPETGHTAARGISGRDPVVGAATALAVTNSLRAGPGVSVSLLRTARALALAAATINEDSSGRFILGCGVSHRNSVEHLGIQYPASPISHLASYAQELCRLSRQDFAFGTGFPVLLAALGPRMLEVAATTADGVVLNWLTAESAASSVQKARAWARDAGNNQPELALYVRVGDIDALTAEAATYDNFSNYRRHFQRQGISSLREVVRQTCTPLKDAVIAKTIKRYRAAGVSLPCLYPVGMGPDDICELLLRVKRALSYVQPLSP